MSMPTAARGSMAARMTMTASRKIIKMIWMAATKITTSPKSVTSRVEAHRPATEVSGSTSPPEYWPKVSTWIRRSRSEEHTSELQSRFDLVCRLLLEKKKQSVMSSVMLITSEEV